MDRKDKNLAADIPAALTIPVGEVIRSWREFRGWSVTELADRAQLTKGYISQLENNKIKRPNDQRLANLAGALGIEVWDIIARRMPTDEESSAHEKLTEPESPSIPSSSGSFFFPQHDRLAEDALIEEIRKLLRAPGLVPEQRREFIRLLKSFVAWLRSRIGEDK